ncbi:MAG TPA: hypothetical protein VH373_08285 [Jatrophihabitantaceae bacterium]
MAVIGDEARAALERFVTTDPADAGCAETLELLHAYVELVAAGENPEVRYPGVAVHLRSCGPCLDDYQGLLAVVRDADAADPPN